MVRKAFGYTCVRQHEIGCLDFRVERYFGINTMIEEEKMDAVVVCLDKEALI